MVTLTSGSRRQSLRLAWAWLVVAVFPKRGVAAGQLHMKGRVSANPTQGEHQ